MSDDDPECAREFCIMSPTKSVWLLLRNKAMPRVERAAPLGIHLCTEHAGEAVLDDFLNGETWKEVCLQFRKQGLPTPTASLTKLEMRPIEEAA